MYYLVTGKLINTFFRKNLAVSPFFRIFAQ